MYEFDFSGQMQQGYNPPPAQAKPARRLSNSRVWYAAYSPLIGLFVEIYANSFALGILVWVCAIISCFIALALDKKYLNENNVNTDTLNTAYIFIPPLYMHKRAKLVGEKSFSELIFIFLFAYALLSNGFTAAALMDEDDMIYQVQENYIFNISGFEDDTNASMYNGTIGDLFEEYIGNENSDEDLCKWEAAKDDGVITVNASYDEADKISFSAEFSMDYDGYAYGDVVLEKITLDGKTYEGDEALEQLSKILSEELDKSSSDESSESLQDSNSVSYKTA